MGTSRWHMGSNSLRALGRSQHLLQPWSLLNTNGQISPCSIRKSTFDDFFWDLRTSSGLFFLNLLRECAVSEEVVEASPSPTLPRA